ncbi:MAG: hypothetical protein ACKVQW_13145 [Pyrinomonadaceae bacterium]
MKKQILTFLPLISALVAVLFTGLVVAQDNDPKIVERSKWIDFKAPNNSFTISLPEMPRIEKAEWSPSAAKNDEVNIFRCASFINYYSLSSLFDSESSKSRMVIREINVSRCSRNPAEFDKEITSLIASIAGGSPKGLVDRPIEINGIINGHNIRYESGSFYPGTKDSPIYNKVYAVDAGTRLFFLLYFHEHGLFGEQEEIFRTFRPKFVTCKQSVEP